MSKDYFSYNPGTFPADSFRISPSQLSRFFDTTSQWWREFYLGEAPAFTGSTASHLGTCVHAAAAMYHDSQSIDHAAILSYIDSLPSDIDKAEIRFQYPLMANTLIQSYLSRNTHTYSEEFVSHELLPNIFVGGSIDASTPNIVVDFKTTSSKTAPTSFPRPYYFQLLTYAWLLRKQGRPIDQLRLVYVTRTIDGGYSEKTGNKLKDYPSTCTVLNHLITQADWDLIDGCLNLIADSIAFAKANPQSLYLLAQDFRLRTTPAPLLFKD